MNHTEQVKCFADDLDKLINRYSEEFDIDYCSVVGCLHMKCYTLIRDAIERYEDGEII